jgi:cytochrome P450
MLFSEGQEWKRTRGLFNPGFAISHLMTLVPSIVDDVAIFHGKFGELADSGEVSPIEELLARLTIDIMGHIILDHDLNSQTTENALVRAFRSQAAWTPKPMMREWMIAINPVFLFAQVRQPCISFCHFPLLAPLYTTEKR